MTHAPAYQIETSPSPSGIRPHSWSAERRQRAAERIRAHKPWLKTTGPKTVTGKSVSKMNALKHGRRSAAEIAKHREVMKFLREQKLFLKHVRVLLRIRRQAAKSRISTNEMIERLNFLQINRINHSRHPGAGRDPLDISTSIVLSHNENCMDPGLRRDDDQLKASLHYFLETL